MKLVGSTTTTTTLTESSTYTIDAFQPKVISDENGIKTIVVYRDNEDGKRVKVIVELGGERVAWQPSTAILIHWIPLGDTQNSIQTRY